LTTANSPRSETKAGIWWYKPNKLNSMAHNLDFSKGAAAFVSHKLAAWHGLGTVLDNPLTVNDALSAGGLDFQVIKLPNFHFIPAVNFQPAKQIMSDESFFTFRTDTGAVLGSKLGKDYTVLQNSDALNLVDEILQQGKATIETAGAIDGGRKVFVTLKYNRDIIVSGQDRVNEFCLITTSHDGSLAITAKPVNIRVVCENTLRAALGQKSDAIKIRHTSNAELRLSEAMRVLNLLSDTNEQDAEIYGRMAETVIDKDTMLAYFAAILCGQDELSKLKKGAMPQDVLSTHRRNHIKELAAFAIRGTGQRETYIQDRPTAWTAYNAVTGVLARKRYASADARANSMLFGSGSSLLTDSAVKAMNIAQIETIRTLQYV